MEKLYDMSTWSAFQEDDAMFDFEEMLEDDACLAWEKDLEIEIV